MPDHVHLLISLSKEMAVAEALRLIKTNSSKWVHETFPEIRDFAWQAGYGAFAVSYSNLDGVKRYLARQAQHHRKTRFDVKNPPTASVTMTAPISDHTGCQNILAAHKSRRIPDGTPAASEAVLPAFR
jgi:hypothetical protein